MRSLRPIRALALTGLAGAAGVTLNLVVDAHTSSSERVVPLLTDAGSYLALVPLGVHLNLGPH